MSKAVLVIDMPKTCSECYFCGDTTELPVGNGLYKKVARCFLAKNNIEDPWRNVWWQLDNKEVWCPLKTIPTIDISKINYYIDYCSYERGFSDCLSQIE